MARILVFLGTIAAALTAVAALNWWMDPLGDRYHRRFLDRALSQPKPCFISWAVLGSRTWGEYKVDLFRRAHVDIRNASCTATIAAASAAASQGRIAARLQEPTRTALRRKATARPVYSIDGHARSLVLRRCRSPH